MKHSVAALVFSPDNQKILTVKRRDVSVWVIPGGAVDPGETPEEAVVREVKEETGLNVEIKRKVGIYTPKRFISTITHTFECVSTGGNLTNTDEARDVGFFAVDALPQLFFFIHEIWIHEALEQRPDMIERDLIELSWINAIRYILRHPIHSFRFFLAKVVGLSINS